MKLRKFNEYNDLKNLAKRQFARKDSPEQWEDGTLDDILNIAEDEGFIVKKEIDTVKGIYSKCILSIVNHEYIGVRYGQELKILQDTELFVSSMENIVNRLKQHFTIRLYAMGYTGTPQGNRIRNGKRIYKYITEPSYEDIDMEHDEFINGQPAITKSKLIGYRMDLIPPQVTRWEDFCKKI
jgi:hypothetical protein